MRIKLIIIFLIFIPSLLAGQDQILENNPPSLKWKQINTPGFKIIFPEGLGQESQRIANILEHLRSAETESMGNKLPDKISIILQNQNAISNGFVTLGPRRSELYTMPPQNYNFLGTNNWLDMVAVHEYRHIVQFQHSKTGWNKFFYYLFGENTQAGMAFAAAPQWFWEGDATLTESTFTHSGRGRMPSFNRVFRANLLEGKRFNYHKQHLRSYKDYVPNHYVLGYNFVAHLRRRTKDKDILGKVSGSAFSWPFVPFTFSNALKKHTGTYLVKNYELMMDELDSIWTDQLKGVDITNFNQFNERRSDDFTDYSYPQVLEDGSVVAMKSGIGDVNQFVLFDRSGEEKKLFTFGILNETGMLSGVQNKIVWNEYHFDPRWRIKTYSVIKAYDVEKGRSRTITKKSRYAGAALSPDGNKIITVLTTTDQQHYLTVVDFETGAVVKQFKNPSNAFYSMPRWSDDGQKIVALKIRSNSKAVVQIDAASGTENILIPPGNENIGHPVLYKDHLLYNSPKSGIDNIYALNLSTGRQYQVTSSRYGAYNPAISPDGKTIYYNDHTVNGLDIVRIPFDPQRWRPFNETGDLQTEYYAPLVEQEGHEAILDDIAMTEFPVKKYSKLGHIINIHSWGPYATSDLNRAELGIFSRDVLSTTSIALGYTYDINEETGFASAKLSYQGIYPIIDFEVEKGNRTSDRGTINDEEVKLSWDELSIEGGFRLPLLLTRSKYHSELSFENSGRITKVSDFSNSVFPENRFAPINDSLAYFFRDELTNGNLLANRARVSYYRLHKRSDRDLNSRWGQSVTAEHFSTPFGGDFTGSLFAVRANLYFPSPGELVSRNVFKHHSLYVRLGYQSRDADLDSDLYYFRNRISKPRGFSYPAHEEFSALSVNYTFPVWYPDVAIGPFLNIKRVRVNGFYDYGKGIGKNYYIIYNEPSSTVYSATLDENYLSTGAELFVDFNVMRFSPEVSLGARYSYLLSTGETNIEFLVANIAF